MKLSLQHSRTEFSQNTFRNVQVRCIVVSHDVAVLSYCILSYSQSLDVSIMSNTMRLSNQYELLIKAVWLIQRQSLTMCDSREVASMDNRDETLGQLSTTSTIK